MVKWSHNKHGDWIAHEMLIKDGQHADMESLCRIISTQRFKSSMGRKAYHIWAIRLEPTPYIAYAGHTVLPKGQQ